MAWNQVLLSLGAFGIAIALALLFYAVLFLLLRQLEKGRISSKTARSVNRNCRAPVLWIVLTAAVLIALPAARLQPRAAEVVAHLLNLLLIALAAWLLIRLIRAVEEVLTARYVTTEEDNLRARGVQTQIRVLKRVVVAVIVVLALAVMLMSFDSLRRFGTSILASAGVIGIVAGIAAQRTLANVIAGLQIAITQPVRIDDVVVVENEWGRIEEITLTYVVIRCWDLRRLIVPITHLIEKPFQNWTHATANLLGTVLLQVDYRVPVGEVRLELDRILSQTQFWDGKVGALHVTDVTDHTVVLRALMSAADAARAFELRCLVREKLVDFLRREYPESLPRVRAEIEPTGCGSGGDSGG